MDLIELLSIKRPKCVVLKVDSKALVHPEILPVKTANPVTSPRVCHLVNNDRSSRFITCYDAWAGEGDDGVFHSSIGERPRQDAHIIFLPRVRTNKFLQGLKEIFHLAEFLNAFLHEGGLGYHSKSLVYLVSVEISNEEGKQIGRDRDLHVELISPLNSCSVGFLVRLVFVKDDLSGEKRFD